MQHIMPAAPGYAELRMIAIMDYGVGNLGSILNMLRKAGAAATVTSEPSDLETATRVILPGVGAFDHAMRALHASGLVPPLLHAVQGEGKPLLGICLGMQMLGHRSEEGELPGLGLIEAETCRFSFPSPTDLKVPHMGWNEVRSVRPHPLLAEGDEPPRFYFLHSYYVRCLASERLVGETVHGLPFASVFASGNVMGVQFHPEKSHRFGLDLLRRFATLS